MKVLGSILTAEYIKANAEIDETQQYYKLTVGDAMEVTVANSKNRNSILGRYISDTFSADKFMTRYRPKNYIYFDRDLIENNKADDFSVSISRNEKLSAFVVGKFGKYSTLFGILATTGTLSANNLVEYNRGMYYKLRYRKTALDSTILVAVGLKGGEPFGIWYIPRNRGVFVDMDTPSNLCISAETLKYRDKPEKTDESYQYIDINYFFDRCKLKLCDEYKSNTNSGTIFDELDSLFGDSTQG